MASHRERELFEACLNMAPEDRAAFLRETSRRDPSLVTRVERLLAAHERATEIPESLRGGLPSPFADPSEIGPYRIVERIGEGGMGVVFMAEQMKPIKRPVAIKVVKLGMDTKEVIARFDSERQALALMNHPNIARILDAGATQTGRPYFVMEYVRGESIVDYCDKHAQSLDRRLTLFTDVCKAIEHAHEKGVIHRDIKCSNILVTEEQGTPIPKVIDFGIAKATNQRLTELTLFTKLGHVVGTPEYMSPEQAAGATDIDARTDVYSLGVVLYELLIGVRPFDFRDSTSGYDEILRTIREDIPPTLSNRYRSLGDRKAHHASTRATDTRHLLQRLRGDLEWITQRTLAKDRNDRYQSARALREDVQKVIHGHPVTPAPVRVWSGVKRRLTRSSIFATTAAVLLLAVVSGVLLVRSNTTGYSSTDAGPARVLVLPFEFLGPNEEAYLADGLTDEIIGSLSGLASVTVLGRQTAMYVVSREMPPDAVAEELDVDFVLDGTVRIQATAGGPDQMRIRAALTNTSSLTEIWTETYDGSVDDVFAVQRDVAERVAGALGIELPAGDVQQLTGEPTQDLAAYDFFLRGNEYSRRSELESPMRSALELYEEATRRDADFAEAWAAASIMRSRLRWRGYDPSDGNLRAARQAGERALALNPNIADGHLALGYYHYYGFRDYQSALTHLGEAVLRRPNDPEVLLAVGVVARRLGEWERATASLRSALNANPRHSEVAITLGETLMALGNYTEAERYFDRAIAIAPDRPGGHLFKTWLYVASQSDISAAVQTLRRGWDEVGGPRLFALYGVYLSDVDWWLSRVLSRNAMYRDMFMAANLGAGVVDSVTYYLHRAEVHATTGDGVLRAAYGDSARTILARETGRYRDNARPSNSLTRAERADFWTRYAHALRHAGARDSTLAAAYRALRFFSRADDALHGSETLIQVGLIEAGLGIRDSAVERLHEAFSHPSSFRADMLQHDPDLSWLVDSLRSRNVTFAGR